MCLRVRGIGPLLKEKVYGGNDLPKSQVLSSEWKSERVREDASGDSEDCEEDGDELPCVIGERKELFGQYFVKRSSLGNCIFGTTTFGQCRPLLTPHEIFWWLVSSDKQTDRTAPGKTLPYSMVFANSAFHPSGVGKWVSASAGKAKVKDVRGVCNENCEIPWECVPYLSTFEVWSRQGALYKSTFTLRYITFACP